MQQSLRHNWKQFTLLVIINGFVGGMVGMERTILPEIAESEFGLRPYPFIFGIVMAASGLFLTIFFVKDTEHFVKKENKNPNNNRPTDGKVFLRTTAWRGNCNGLPHLSCSHSRCRTSAGTG